MARALTFEVWDGYLDERLGTITVSGNRVVALTRPTIRPSKCSRATPPNMGRHKRWVPVRGAGTNSSA